MIEYLRYTGTHSSNTAIALKQNFINIRKVTMKNPPNLNLEKFFKWTMCSFAVKAFLSLNQSTFISRNSTKLLNFKTFKKWMQLLPVNNRHMH